LEQDGKKSISQLQLMVQNNFEVNFPGMTKIAIRVQQVTKGDFDVNDLVGFTSNSIIVSRDMNHASEFFFD
jgi:hypothetical protein